MPKYPPREFLRMVDAFFKDCCPWFQGNSKVEAYHAPVIKIHTDRPSTNVPATTEQGCTGAGLWTSLDQRPRISQNSLSPIPGVPRALAGEITYFSAMPPW